MCSHWRQRLGANSRLAPRTNQIGQLHHKLGNLVAPVRAPLIRGSVRPLKLQLGARAARAPRTVLLLRAIPLVFRDQGLQLGQALRVGLDLLRRIEVRDRLRLRMRDFNQCGCRGGCLLRAPAKCHCRTQHQDRQERAHNVPFSLRGISVRLRAAWRSRRAQLRRKFPYSSQEGLTNNPSETPTTAEKLGVQAPSRRGQ